MLKLAVHCDRGSVRNALMEAAKTVTVTGTLHLDFLSLTTQEAVDFVDNFHRVKVVNTFDCAVSDDAWHTSRDPKYILRGPYRIPYRTACRILGTGYGIAQTQYGWPYRIVLA